MTGGQPIKRHRVMERVPAREIEPLLRKLIRREGTMADAARCLAEFRGTEHAWKQTIHRVLNKHTETMPENRDAIYAALGLDAPAPMYRQRVWRVSGLDPWTSNRRNRAQRNWFYITEKEARRRKEALEEKGLFIDWAVCDAVWKELE